MFELLTMFITGGGSAILGSLLKGVFGAIVDSREQKYQLEMAREIRTNEFALKFQEQLNKPADSRFTRATRRLLAVIGMSTLSAVTILTTIYPSVPLLTYTNISGEGTNSFLWGLVNLQASQTPVAVTTGHLALFTTTIVYPMIVGFYFTPGGRR